MAIATLTIDIVAKLASLQTGFDRAAQLAERNSRRIEQAFAGVGNVLKGALAGFGVQQVVSAFNSLAEGLAQFKDVAEQTGIAVEELSKLEPVARQAGLGIGEVADISLKLSKALSGVDDESRGAGKALAQIGIDLDRFRQLGAAEQMQALARALDAYADDANKAAIGQAILGKQWAQSAGFLKDLAQAGQLNATVTAEQARQADEYNKAVIRMQESIRGFGRDIAGFLIPRLNNLREQLALIDWGKVFGAAFGFRSGMLQELARQTNEAGNKFRAAKLKEVADDLERIFNLGGDGKPSAGAFTSVAAEAPKAAKAVADLNREITAYADQLAREKTSLADWLGLRDIDEAVASYRRLQEQLDRINELTGRGAANKLAADLKLVDDAFFEGRISVEEYNNALRKLAGISETVAKESKDAADIARELGLTFSSAFEDAIVGGKNLRDVLHGLEEDIVRIITRKLVTEPIAKTITGALGGFDFGAIFGKLFSSFAGGFATGGLIPSGQWGIVGERGPEIVRAGPGGAMVSSASPANRSIVVNVNVQGGTSAASAQQIGAAAARALAVADARLN